jgi:hypothetical protein
LSPSAAQAAAETTFREAEKQTRAFEVARRVRVVNENGKLLHICTGDSADLQRHLRASNTELIRSHGGKVVGLRLVSSSFTGDRTQTDERDVLSPGVLATQTTRTLQHGRRETTEHRWMNGRNVQADHPFSPQLGILS